MTTPVLEQGIREEELKSLDQYRRGLAEAPVLYRAYGFSKGTDDAGMMIFVASEESPDRVGDVISVEGWDTASFEKNPVLLFAHDHRMAPIGRVPKVWKHGKELLNTVDWDMEDPLAMALMGKYQRGFMRAESVGFRPIEFKDRDEGEGINFTKQELLEISLVSVPMHPKALRKMMGEGKPPIAFIEYLSTVLWVPIPVETIQAMFVPASESTEAGKKAPQPSEEETRIAVIRNALRTAREAK